MTHRDGLSLPVAALLAGGAIVLCFLSLWFVMKSGDSDIPTKKWFYDLNTNELFVGAVDVLPPIAAPSGDLAGQPPGTPAGVEAMVFKDTDGSTRIGWLTTAQPGVTYDPESMIPVPHWIKRPDDTKWVDENSADAQAIINAAMQGPGEICYPDP